jgi:hypothetical protein
LYFILTRLAVDVCVDVADEEPVAVCVAELVIVAV